MKVLFASSEIYPYAKTGGLADVSEALPSALKRHVDVSRVMPLYGFMDKKKFKLHDAFSVKIVKNEYEIEIFRQSKGGIVNYFVKAPLLSDTENLYGNKDGDYVDNDSRFAIFCKAVVELSKRLSVETIHLNDWQTALVAFFVKESALDIKTVLTIHNLAYQGVFAYETLSKLGIDEKYFNIDAFEFYGKANFLKAGVAYSNAVTTVSPTYAKEILTHEFGCGLEGFLAHHKDKIGGILNGVNAKLYDPSSDKSIEFAYDASSVEIKRENKVAFIKNSTLKDPRKPLFAMVSRLVEQKGIDLIMESLEETLAKKINLFILGDGSQKVCDRLSELSQKYDNFEFREGFSDALSRQTYAAADFFLMPSVFEPCGLSQFIAMRYGATPIVHGVGGLKDSVFEEENGLGRGIVYSNQNKEEFLGAIDRALELKKNSLKFKELIKSNMQRDFSFESSALAYLEIYKGLQCLKKN
jgi:starch synthase